MTKILTVILAALIVPVEAQPHASPDPRAFGFSVVRLPSEKPQAGRYLRPESTYSIVVHGDNVMHRRHEGAPAYRLHGIEREFSFPELKKILTAFYKSFPLDAKVPYKGLGGRMPFPNIIYLPGGWNEPKRDGLELVDQLSRQHGVGLFHCQPNTYLVEVKETERGKTPMHDQACRDYYLERLKLAIKAELDRQ